MAVCCVSHSEYFFASILLKVLQGSLFDIFHFANQILLPAWRATARRFLHVSEKDRGAKYQISFLPVVRHQGGAATHNWRHFEDWNPSSPSSQGWCCWQTEAELQRPGLDQVSRFLAERNVRSCKSGPIRGHIPGKQPAEFRIQVSGIAAAEEEPCSLPPPRKVLFSKS